MFRKNTYVLTVIILLVTLVGCNGNNNSGGATSGNFNRSNSNPDQVFSRMSQAIDRQNYYFDGSASIQRDHFNGQKLINFRGHSSKEQKLYLNLAISPRDNGVVEDMDFYSQGENLYIRFADDIKWQQVDEPAGLLYGEVNQWNPHYHFQRMSKLGQNINHVDMTGGNEVRSVRVVLDPNQLKQEFLANLRQRFDGNQTENANKRFEKVILEGEDEALFLDQISSIKDELRAGLNELEESLSIQGDYVVSYDPKTNAPTKMVYTQELSFSEGGENHHEVSEVEIYFRNYGAELDLPDTEGIS